jgi:esterase/lipase
VAFLTCDIFSDALQVGTSMSVVLPQRTEAQIGVAGGAVEGEPPVLYLLHGLSDDHTAWHRYTAIGRYAEAAGLAVVMPGVHRSFYSDERHGHRYWEFVSEELPTVVRAFFRVTHDPSRTFVAGLSMGGCLALRLAEQRPAEVAGLLLVNPSVAGTDRRLVLTPVLRRFVSSVSGIGNDIKRPGGDEYGYDRIPLNALDSLRALWRVTRDDLPKVVAPLVVYRSVEDHVVEPLSSQLITQRVSSTDLTERVLDNSYHVATLDYDAPDIFRSSVEFIARHKAVSDRAV